MSDNVVIRVENVYKDFILPHERTGSVKGVFTSMFSKATRVKEKQHALKDISFEVNKGEFFGIVGRNGSGKSTLLKILATIYQPTKGSVSTAGKLVPFIELGVGFNPELSGRDNVYLNGAILGFSVKEVDAMYESIVEFAELGRFMDQKLKNYSSGMQVRLAFAMAIRANADILLIDEVLAVGDADFQRKCYQYFKKLKKENKTVIFVSHDMEAIREYCDRVMLIEKSKILESGSPDKITQTYHRIFVEKEEEVSDSSNNSWGNGDLKIVEAKVSHGDEKWLTVSAKAQVYKDTAKVIYGLHILSSDGKEVTAFNNRMVKAKDVVAVKKGSTVDLSWELENIFNDGLYTVTMTLVDETGQVLDWSNEITSFTVKRSVHSTTAVMPPVSVKYKIS